MRIALLLSLVIALDLGAQSTTARGVRASGARPTTARDTTAKPGTKPRTTPGAKPAAPAGAVPDSATAAAVADGAAPASSRALSPVSAVELRTAPTGRALAQVQPGAVLAPLARERGWVRVRFEGWVQEKDLAPAGADLGSPVAAADLRAQGAEARGRVVRWTVQVLALQTADPLRRDLAPDETYLLARGPEQEQALLYLVIPPSLLESARSLPALTEAVITARVRTGKSDPAGVPVLELTSLARK
jgi:hypothetical protein